MIENIKKAVDDFRRLKEEFNAKENEIVSEFDDLGVISFNTYRGSGVHMDSLESLENIADGQDLKFEEWEGDNTFRGELSFTKDGVQFFTLVSHKEYERYTRNKEAEPEESEAESARAQLTEYERKMKEAGHKQTDFM